MKVLLTPLLLSFLPGAFSRASFAGLPRASATASLSSSTSKSSSEVWNAVPRGGDLGPLDTTTAARVLVGFTMLNGIMCFLAPDGTVKGWAGDSIELTEKEKLLVSTQGLNGKYINKPHH